MARIGISGWESASDKGESNNLFNGTGCSIENSIVRSGSHSLKVLCVPGVTAYHIAISGFLFNRAYIRVTSLPLTTPRVIVGAINTNNVNIRLTTSGSLSFYVDTTLIGTSSTALVNADKWYRVEWRTGTASNVPVLLIDGNTEITDSPSSWTYPGSFGANDIVADTYTAYFDDVASDDSDWCGEGKVVLLLPISDNARDSLWTGGAGGTTNLYEAVNNTPPIGTASETDSTQIEHAGGASGTTDQYTANMATYASAGIGAYDIIVSVVGKVVHGEDEAAGTKQLKYHIVSNPSSDASVTFNAGLDAGALGTFPTNWATAVGFPSISYPLVDLNTSPIMRVVRPETASGVASICFMGINVEYRENSHTPTTYYVRTSGSDTNNGLTPATAWRTVGKALGSSGITNGDTVYVGPGIYRESLTVALSTTTPNETFIIGDIYGAYTGDTAGEVRITNYLTDDTSAPDDSPILNLNIYSYLTFQNIYFHGALQGSSENYLIYAPSDGYTLSMHITFRDCAFALFSLSDLYYEAIQINGAPDSPMHWLFDRCHFEILSGGYAITVFMYQTHSADYDCDFIFQNCNLLTEGGIYLSGNLPYKPGGFVVKNCTVHTGGTYESITLNHFSSSYPSYVYNSVIVATNGYLALGTTAANTLIEDYNYLISQGQSDPRSANVTSGSNTVINMDRALLWHFGQEAQLGLDLRPLGYPTVNSQLLSFGNHSSTPGVDILNRPRPASLNGNYAMNSVGAYERHDIGIEDTLIYDSAPASMKIIGPGDHEFKLPVNPVSTNVTVMAYYNAAHSSGSPPQAQLLANPLIGLTSGSTLTMTEPEDTWEQLAFPTFVPTDYGVVTLRCLSRSSSGSGAAWFDSITV